MPQMMPFVTKGMAPMSTDYHSQAFISVKREKNVLTFIELIELDDAKRSHEINNYQYRFISDFLIK